VRNFSATAAYSYGVLSDNRALLMSCSVDYRWTSSRSVGYIGLVSTCSPSISWINHLCYRTVTSGQYSLECFEPHKAGGIPNRNEWNMELWHFYSVTVDGIYHCYTHTSHSFPSHISVHIAWYWKTFYYSDRNTGCLTDLPFTVHKAIYKLWNDAQ